MNTLEAIATRCSTRRFANRSVEQEKLDAIVTAAGQAPSGGNFRGCHLVVIRDAKVLNHLAEIATECFAEMTYDENTYQSKKNSINLSRKGLYEFYYHAPVLIVVADQKSHPNAMADSACALENMMLAANELDLGSCWINQMHWLEEDARLRDYLEQFGITKEETITGSLAVGYADREDGLPNRKPFAKAPLRVDYVG
ncbi:MAG: nitroreductase family protein [Lachnospiraceae bacterium]|nr:nitroreductase family protein [Lachnospiraceae bacterium]